MTSEVLTLHLEDLLEEHRTKARLSQNITLSKQTVRGGTEENRQINDEEEKAVLRLVVSTDYRMRKLVPHWEYSPQPGSTYYLQKLSHDLWESNHSVVVKIRDSVVSILGPCAFIKYLMFHLCVKVGKYQHGYGDFTSLWTTHVQPTRSTTCWVGPVS